jgi:hypothetical protein
MTGSIATDQPTLVDRLLAHMQQRFPREFEIALLSAQNEELRERVAQPERTEGGEVEGQQAFDFSKADEG